MTNKTWVCDAQGNYRFTTPPKAETILELASSILETKLYQGDCFQQPEAAGRFLCCKIGSLEYEVFCCLFLDTKHRLIHFEQLFRGTIDGATVHPREVVKRALELNAAATIVGHNHPSGVSEPSSADQALTTRLKAALALIDVRVLDHIIVGGDEFCSLSERGLL